MGRALELSAQLAFAPLLAEEFLGVGDAGWRLGVARGRDGEKDGDGAGGQGLAVAGSEVPGRSGHGGRRFDDAARPALTPGELPR